MKIKALTKCREAKGMTGLAFAAWLQEKGVTIDSSQISRWERGQRFPRLTTIVAVARVTGLKVENLAPNGEE